MNEAEQSRLYEHCDGHKSRLTLEDKWLLELRSLCVVLLFGATLAKIMNPTAEGHFSKTA